MTTRHCERRGRDAVGLLRRPHRRRPARRHRSRAERGGRRRRRRGALPRAARLADSLAAVSLVFACIAPHGDVDLDPALRAAMEELGRRCAAAAPEVAVVVYAALRPRRGPLRRRHGREGGGVGDRRRDSRPRSSRRDAADPRRLVRRQRPGEPPSSRSTGEPRCRSTSSRAPRVVVVAPARDRPLEEHLRLGEAIAALPGRVALIASADHGHAHDRGRPLRLRPGGSGLRRAAAGDPRLGPPRLPAARRARRAGEGRLALAAPRSPGRGRGGGASGRARVRGADVLRDARRGGSDGGVDAATRPARP